MISGQYICIIVRCFVECIRICFMKYVVEYRICIVRFIINPVGNMTQNACALEFDY